MRKRGWNESSIRDTIIFPEKTVAWRDSRHLPDGTQMNDPATAFIRSDGSYIIRNDRTGEVVQISDRTDPNWIAPWDEP
jgi:filamentous hemagglutinin